MILQLNPSIYVSVTSKENQEGRAIGWLDYGTEYSLLWIVALENGEVWIVRNEEIRIPKNWSLNYDEKHR